MGALVKGKRWKTAIVGAKEEVDFGYGDQINHCLMYRLWSLTCAAPTNEVSQTSCISTLPLLGITPASTFRLLPSLISSLTLSRSLRLSSCLPAVSSISTSPASELPLCCRPGASSCSLKSSVDDRQHVRKTGTMPLNRIAMAVTSGMSCPGDCRSVTGDKWFHAIVFSTIAMVNPKEISGSPTISMIMAPGIAVSRFCNVDGKGESISSG